MKIISARQMCQNNSLTLMTGKSASPHVDNMLLKMIHGSIVNNLIENLQKNTPYMIISPLSFLA
jgi:hypothetical protein